jgi:NADH dehydrogenase (ubiquinone) Fe-S protein 6
MGMRFAAGRALRKGWKSPRRIARAPAMSSQPETVTVTEPRVSCDGSSDIPGGAALGHPKVWLEIDEKGYVECGYCDRRFVLKGGAADQAAA